MSNEIKFSEIEVSVNGTENAFAILGSVTKAMKRAGVDPVSIKEYTDEATSGDYDNLIDVTERTVTII